MIVNVIMVNLDVRYEQLKYLGSKPYCETLSYFICIVPAAIKYTSFITEYVIISYWNKWIGVFETVNQSIISFVCFLLYSFQSPLIPLYLGADIFSNTDIRVENHPRYHAKFAKKGYATKLTFSTGNWNSVVQGAMSTFTCCYKDRLLNLNMHW